MKAIVYRKFGSAEVLEVDEIAEPTAGSGFARVRVEAAGLNPKDILVRKGKMKWLSGENFPRVPGYDFAGTLMDDTDVLKAGDEVFGMVNSHQGGTCAEVVSVPFDEMVPKPGALTMVEAASMPLVCLTALQALRDDLGVKVGDRVLMNGASGGVGTAAVQIGRILGLQTVAVCSERNAQMVRELGASEVIDYNERDPLEERNLHHFFDIYGNKSWPEVKKTLRDDGHYCTTVPSLGSVVRGALSKLGMHRAYLVVVKSRREDLERLVQWIDTGLLEPVVDRVYSMHETVEAHEYIESRRARGKVVLEI